MAIMVTNITSNDSRFNLNQSTELPLSTKIFTAIALMLATSLPLPTTQKIGIAAGIAIAALVSKIASPILFNRGSASPEKNLWLDLQQKTAALHPDYLSATESNHRFANIRCPKETAISVEGHYLHANRLNNGARPFIASQAPLVKDYDLFWKAIFENHPIIVDLTTTHDHKAGSVSKYYPEKLHETKKYGSVSVKLVSVKGKIYTYQVTNTKTGVVKTIQRYHFAKWNDFGVISLPALQTLVQQVESLCPNQEDQLWVHCRAGIGRTGTLITALILKEKIQRGEINQENLETALVDTIIELRKQRGPAFVQQESQLELLYQYGRSLIA